MTEHTSLDILCFGAHPDDVEIGMAGTIAKQVRQGYRVGICDLTLAELSSNGTVTSRQQEALEAARILGVSERINLGFPDRGLERNRDVLGTIVSVIRQYRPSHVCLPFDKDRHPDHVMTTQLVEEAVFTANIGKYQWGTEQQENHKVATVLYYIINSTEKPMLLVDVTQTYQQKKASLLAYESQFAGGEGSVPTRLNTGFIEVVEGRDKWFGKLAEVTYAEGFIMKEPYLLPDLLALGQKGATS
jgi:bacillithiol biosynthesis deacetylase BshB1